MANEEDNVEIIVLDNSKVSVQVVEENDSNPNDDKEE